MELKKINSKVNAEKLNGLLKRIQTVVTRQVLEKIIQYVSCFLIALVSTRGIAFGNYAPFPVAFVASVPKKYMVPSVFGAMLGYLIPSSVYVPFRYMVAILTVLAIRWALSELKKVNSSQLFAPIISFLPLLATGITMALINSSLITVASLYVAEAFLAAGCAYFFTRCARLITEKRYRSKIDNVDIACVCVSVSVIILSLTEIQVFTISIGRILMILMILICAGSGGIAGGSISGIASGAISGLSSFGLSYLSGAYGLGGLVAGIFAPSSKLLSTIAFVVAHGIASLQISDTSSLFDTAIEVAIASVIYMIIPQNRFVTELFSLKKDNLSGTSLRNNIIMRLNHTSQALSGISSQVNEISEKLSKTTSSSMSQVYNSAAGEICAACSMRAVCWKKNKSESIKTFASLTPVLKGKGKVETLDFGDGFINSCSRVGEMRESVNKFYKDFLSRQTAEIRAANIRDIASEQFKVTSAMLVDMASEISLYESFDEEATERIYEVFRRMEIFPIEVCCRRDKYGRITVEAEVEKNKNIKLNKGQLVREISKVCSRNFAPPCFSNTEYTYKIQMCQKPVLDVTIGMKQQSASKLCGDSAITFYDGQGKYIAIISDGMGTGGLAAVDGAMASSIMESLLKAGMGYDTALRLVNSALMSKSEDESLATMDIASLDLFTGKCEFRKAGATTSFIKRGRKVQKIEEDSLPVGIIQDINFSINEESLKKGDLICMLSDGATACGSDWIEETLLSYPGIDANELASEIVSYAKKCRSDGHTDDITALIIMVVENL